MRKLVVATDLTERGGQALDRALVLAGRQRAELLLVHVASKGAARLATARRALEAQAGAVFAPRGVMLRPMVLSGPVPETLAHLVEAEEAELIVTGPHRRRLLADLLAGISAGRLLRLGAAPVLVANRPASGPYRRLLVAVDLSETAREALLCARRLGLLEGAELLLVHAHGPLAREELLEIGVPDEVLARAVREDAHELEDLVAELGLDSARTRLEAVVGVPFEVIRDRARDFDADLVVVGTHGRSGIERAVLGSVAEQVLHGVDCDVLAVPAEPRGAT